VLNTECRREMQPQIDLSAEKIVEMGNLKS